MMRHWRAKLPHILVCLGVVCLGVAAQPGRGLAQDETQVDVDEAMQSIGKPPWYDKEADGFQPPTVGELKDNPIRREGWLAKETQKKETTTTTTNNRTWASAFNNFDGDWFSTIVIVMLATVLIVVVVLLSYHSLRTYMPGRWERTKTQKAIEIDPAKVEELPFEIQEASYDNPLDQAAALMQAGRFNESIIYLYGYMLLALDQSRKIELQKGKTNRMYLREIHNMNLSAIVEEAMLLFELAYFGKHEITAEQFDHVWRQLDEFHRLATAAPPAQDQAMMAAEVSPA